MSPRRALAVSAAFGMLAALAVAGKVAIVQKAAADDLRLERDVIRQLQAQGFATSKPRGEIWDVVARRASCGVRVQFRNIGPQLVDWMKTSAGSQPVLFGYRGNWTAAIPVARPLIERKLQERAFALGLRYARPALLGFTASPGCPAPGQVLNGLTVYARAS